jgi:hypothetical protein
MLLLWEHLNKRKKSKTEGLKVCILIKIIPKFDFCKQEYTKYREHEEKEKKKSSDVNQCRDQEYECLKYYLYIYFALLVTLAPLNLSSLSTLMKVADAPKSI